MKGRLRQRTVSSEDVVSIPQKKRMIKIVLKYFNPNLIGSSFGSHWIEIPGEEHYENDVLNAAQSGKRKQASSRRVFD